MSLKKVSLWTENLHFPLFSFVPLSSSLFGVAWILMLCSAWVFPKMMMSSDKFQTPGMSGSISAMVFWNILAAAFTPNNKRLLCQIPACVVNAVTWRLASSSSSWWYALDKSSLLNMVELLRSEIKSLRVGMMCFSLLMALLSSCMSMHNLTPLSAFGTTMIGLTNGVGPSTFSMISSFSSLSSLASTSFRTWNGIHLCCWDTGCPDGSIWSLILMSEMLPTLSAKSLGNCSVLHLLAWRMTAWTVRFQVSLQFHHWEDCHELILSHSWQCR